MQLSSIRVESHMSDFEYIIASSPDREKVFCEIYYHGKIIAEISQETSNLCLEIYPPKNKKWWNLPLEDFQKAIDYGKNHLLGKI